jgi:predicted MFS family arabinose efflux permease
MGTQFHREQWLGGYASHKRRLYRLAHISFFGLALVNLMFYFTARDFDHASSKAVVASWGFIAGAVTMPACCLIMAHKPRLRALFLLPVASLVTAGIFTLLEIVKL